MGLHHHYRTGSCTRHEYQAQGEGLTLRLDALLRRRSLKAVGNERLRLGLLKQHEHGRLLRFLEDSDIPPTNNPAERSLRTVVMARKVSQCSKNSLGAQTYMRIKSARETARLRSQDSTDVLISLCSSKTNRGWPSDARKWQGSTWKVSRYCLREKLARMSA